MTRVLPTPDSTFPRRWTPEFQRGRCSNASGGMGGWNTQALEGRWKALEGRWKGVGRLLGEAATDQRRIRLARLPRMGHDTTPGLYDPGTTDRLGS